MIICLLTCMESRWRVVMTDFVWSTCQIVGDKGNLSVVILGHGVQHRTQMTFWKILKYFLVKEWLDITVTETNYYGEKFIKLHVERVGCSQLRSSLWTTSDSGWNLLYWGVGGFWNLFWLLWGLPHHADLLRWYKWHP